MNPDNVSEYTGQHAITFTVNGVSRNTWTDWGLIPSSRHSEPVHGIWSNAETISGVNGQEDMVRMYPYNAVNSYENLRAAIRNDNRDGIRSAYGFDIYQPSEGSFSFIIADQSVSYFAKQQEIINFLHNQVATIRFADDPSKMYTARVVISSFGSGNDFSSVSIGYSVLSE